jgi:hypothetical protein
MLFGPNPGWLQGNGQKYCLNIFVAKILRQQKSKKKITRLYLPGIRQSSGQNQDDHECGSELDASP